MPIVHVLVLHGAYLDAVDGAGRSVLHLESTMQSREIATFLLDRGMDIDIKDEVCPVLLPCTYLDSVPI